MIPYNNKLLNSDITVQNSPSKTYAIDFNKNIMSGTIDGIEALKQAIYLILNIERYDYVIYSWNYGVELKDLFGKPTTYVCALLPQRIKSALLQDDRIINVTNFDVSAEGNTVSATFTVESIFGILEQEVSYNV